MTEKPKRKPGTVNGERNSQSRVHRTDRGQAYTLEGFVGAIIVLTAVLFALQSVVITPTTGGAVDRTVQAQLQQEAKDALTVAENDGTLSSLVRYWDVDENGDGDEYYGSNVPHQRGNYSADRFANSSHMHDVAGFGDLLDQRFRESGRSYNVELVYQTNESESESENGNASTDSFYLVYQGRPSPNAFAASHAVTLTDGQRLTAPGNRHTTLEEAEENGYPIPDVGDGELYNVVEVRLVVW